MQSAAAASGSPSRPPSRSSSVQLQRVECSDLEQLSDDTDLDEDVKVGHLIAEASSDSEIDGLQQGKCSTIYFQPSLF